MARHGGSARGMRQRKHWHGLGATSANFTANATAILGGFSFADPATILRTIGSVVVVPGAAVVALDLAEVVFGLALVSTDAFTAGAGSMPDPFSEPEFDWLWWKTVYYANGRGGDGAPDEARYVDVESKAMRKLKPGETLVMIGQYVDIVGTPALDVDVNVRFLVGE